MLLNVGSGGGAAAAVPAGGATGGQTADASTEEPKKEEKEEGEIMPRHSERLILMFITLAEKEESDEDMGFGLFD